MREAPAAATAAPARGRCAHDVRHHGDPDGHRPAIQRGPRRPANGGDGQGGGIYNGGTAFGTPSVTLDGCKVTFNGADGGTGTVGGEGVGGGVYNIGTFASDLATVIADNPPPPATTTSSGNAWAPRGEGIRERNIGTRWMTPPSRSRTNHVRHSPRGTRDAPPRATRIHIIGVGSDGLAGLTARAREILHVGRGRARLRGGAGAVPELTAERRVLAGDLPEAVRSGRPSSGKRMAVVASGDPAVLRRRPLPVRPARQGPLRGPAARQQHAARLRPRQGDLGGGVPHQPAPRIRSTTCSTASAPPRRSACSPARSEDPPTRRPRTARPRHRLLPRLRLREPRRPGRARHAGRAGRDRARWSSTRSTS